MIVNRFILIVIFDLDIESPHITHNFKNLTDITDPGQPSVIVTWDEPERVTDNSGSVTLTSNYQSGDAFPIGRTDVIYTATDESDNIATVQFTVIVKGIILLETVGVLLQFT